MENDAKFADWYFSRYQYKLKQGSNISYVICLHTFTGNHVEVTKTSWILYQTDQYSSLMAIARIQRTYLFYSLKLRFEPLILLCSTL